MIMLHAMLWKVACFQIEGTISVLFGILPYVSALLIRWGLTRYQP